MASCELCDKPATTKARIEGVTMQVCSKCAAFGTELRPPSEARLHHAARVNAPQQRRPIAQAAERDLVIDFGNRLRYARERKKLTLEDAARLLTIQASTLRHYESGTMRPDEKATAKLERFYTLSLLE